MSTQRRRRWRETPAMQVSGGGAGDDPGMLALAAELAGLARTEGRTPFVVGIVGSVAVGKSTIASGLAELLGPDGHGLHTEVIATDAFLLPNEQLEPLGGAMVKGHPQSYDWAALAAFLAEARNGAPELAVPVYSHEVFDVVPGERHVVRTPEVLIVEGLNLLQGPPAAPVDLTEHLDHAIYLHAPAPVIEDWFVARFRDAVGQEHETPDGFYAMFAGMSDAEVESIARWTWNEINAPNLQHHIEPTRPNADVVVHKKADHSIERIQHQRRS